MTGTGFLLILVGIFIAVNATNIVGVMQGNKTIGQTPTPKSGAIQTNAASSSGSGFSGGKSTGGGGGGGTF